VRPTDVLGRIGGEEFAAVLPGLGREAAMGVAERIRLSFEARGMYVDGKRLNATLSAGVASGQGEGIAISSLLRDADAALYEAKSTGRNRVVFAEGDLGGGQSRVVRVA
jgi:diguanylate cyclase (GGDEF)-like protein